jgi:hypothetical protein
MNIPAQQAELTFSEAQRPKVVRLRLTSEQTKELAPLAIDAGINRQNVLFIATAVPSWSMEEETTIWELQVAKIQAKAGPKLAKVILASTNS